MEKKNSWGGSRAGAGRKKKEDNVPIHIYIDKDVADFVRAKARAEERPMGEIIEEYILIAETDEGIEPRGY